MKRSLLSLILLALGAPFLHATDSNDVDWKHEFMLSRPPSEYTPRWKKIGGGSSTVKDGLLTLFTENESTVYWKFLGGEGDEEWDPSQPTTVEFRAEFDGTGPTSGAAVITLADGKNYYAFFLKTAAMKTYRILLEAEKARLYVEGEADSIASAQGSPVREDRDTRFLYFGDASGKVEGTSRWEYIRWTNEGAFPFSK